MLKPGVKGQEFLGLHPAFQQGEPHFVDHLPFAARIRHVEERPRVAHPALQVGLGQPLHRSAQGQPNPPVLIRLIGMQPAGKNRRRPAPIRHRHEFMEGEGPHLPQLPLPQKDRSQALIHLARQQVPVGSGAGDHIEGHPRLHLPPFSRLKIHLHTEVRPSRIELDLPADQRRGVEGQAQTDPYPHPCPFPGAVQPQHAVTLAFLLDHRRTHRVQRTQANPALIRIGVPPFFVHPQRAQHRLSHLHPAVCQHPGFVVSVFPPELAFQFSSFFHRNSPGRSPHADPLRFHLIQHVRPGQQTPIRERIAAHRIVAGGEILEDGPQRLADLGLHFFEALPVAELHFLVHQIDAHPANAVVHRVLQQAAAPGLELLRRVRSASEIGQSPDRFAHLVKQVLTVARQQL